MTSCDELHRMVVHLATTPPQRLTSCDPQSHHRNRVPPFQNLSATIMVVRLATQSHRNRGFFPFRPSTDHLTAITVRLATQSYRNSRSSLRQSRQSHRVRVALRRSVNFALEPLLHPHRPHERAATWIRNCLLGGYHLEIYLHQAVRNSASQRTKRPVVK